MTRQLAALGLLLVTGCAVDEAMDARSLDGGADTSMDGALDGGADAATDGALSGSDAATDGALDAGIPALTALPPWLVYCEPPACTTPPAVVYVCPGTAPDCVPSRTTTVLPSVDGRRISAIFFPLILPEGAVVRAISGGANVVAHLVTAFAPAVEVHSDEDILISYYNLAPRWGGTVPLDFVSSTRTSTVLDSVFFRHPSYDTGTAAIDLHDNGRAAIEDERRITGITSEHIRAFFMPAELAGVSGEGNFSYGDGIVTSNYGNPDYIQALGGILNVASPRFAHECAHELFNEVAASFGGDASCLNEGIADALAYVSGHLPLADFGPIGLRGDNFEDGCASLSEIHDVGNCYFWHLRMAGHLDAMFLRELFHPRHVYDFDSCNQNLERTGNAILIMFTEATSNADMIPVLDAMGIPHAASYEAALQTFGW